jgi:hypothetical protein
MQHKVMVLDTFYKSMTIDLYKHWKFDDIFSFFEIIGIGKTTENLFSVHLFCILRSEKHHKSVVN